MFRIARQPGRCPPRLSLLLVLAASIALFRTDGAFAATMPKACGTTSTCTSRCSSDDRRRTRLPLLAAVVAPLLSPAAGGGAGPVTGPLGGLRHFNYLDMGLARYSAAPWPVMSSPAALHLDGELHARRPNNFPWKANNYACARTTNSNSAGVACWSGTKLAASLVQHHPSSVKSRSWSALSLRDWKPLPLSSTITTTSRAPPAWETKEIKDLQQREPTKPISLDAEGADRVAFQYARSLADLSWAWRDSKKRWCAAPRSSAANHDFPAGAHAAGRESSSSPLPPDAGAMSTSDQDQNDPVRVLVRDSSALRELMLATTGDLRSKTAGAPRPQRVGTQTTDGLWSFLAKSATERELLLWNWADSWFEKFDLTTEPSSGWIDAKFLAAYDKAFSGNRPASPGAPDDRSELHAIPTISTTKQQQQLQDTRARNTTSSINNLKGRPRPEVTTSIEVDAILKKYQTQVQLAGGDHMLTQPSVDRPPELHGSWAAEYPEEDGEEDGDRFEDSDLPLPAEERGRPREISFAEWMERAETMQFINMDAPGTAPMEPQSNDQAPTSSSDESPPSRPTSIPSLHQRSRASPSASCSMQDHVEEVEDEESFKRRRQAARAWLRRVAEETAGIGLSKNARSRDWDEDKTTADDAWLHQRERVDGMAALFFDIDRGTTSFTAATAVDFVSLLTLLQARSMCEPGRRFAVAAAAAGSASGGSTRGDTVRDADPARRRYNFLFQLVLRLSRVVDRGNEAYLYFYPGRLRLLLRSALLCPSASYEALDAIGEEAAGREGGGRSSVRRLAAEAGHELQLFYKQALDEELQEVV